MLSIFNLTTNKNSFELIYINSATFFFHICAILLAVSDLSESF